MRDSGIITVGLGNLLLGDEGAGVHALHMLQERFPHLPVNFYDGGTRGLTLLPFLEEASYILILDAVRSEESPGTVLEFSKDQLLSTPPLKFSAHDIALPDLLALLRYLKGKDIHLKLLGIVPKILEPSIDLSPEVSRSLPALVDRAEEILEGWIGLKKLTVYQ